MSGLGAHPRMPTAVSAGAERELSLRPDRGGADGTTTATPSDVVEAAYELLSFPPGSTPRWPEFQALFVDRAVLAIRVFPSDPEVSVLTLQAYAHAQMQHGLREEGYSETPGDQTVETVGDVAIVRQAFTMNFADRAPIPAVDVFSLVRERGRWRILSVVSDVVTHGREGAT